MDEKFGTGLSVLVVDDEQGILDLFRVFLEEQQFRVHTAMSLKEARAERAKHPFDLLLVDKNLPDGSGIEIARDVVVQAADCDVIVITAYASTESAIDALKLGVSDYIEKPFEMDQVETRVKRAVQSLRMRRENRQLMTELAKKNRALENIIEGLAALRRSGDDATSALSQPDEISQVDRSIENQSFGFQYQPIYNGAGERIGWEALCRPDARPFEGPEQLLAAAQRAGRISGLGEVLRTLAVRPLTGKPRDGLLFVNLHPQEFGNLLIQWAERVQPLADKIVFEMADSATTWARGLPNREINALRDLGFALSVDRLPAGYLALDVVDALAPRYVRVPAARLVDPASERDARRIQHLLEVAKVARVDVIAHKVETEAQKKAAVDMGIAYFQGNLLGEPGNPFD